jgi:hypothetical protein
MAFEKGNRLGKKYQPGQSGNPGGQPKSRTEFEREFYHALLTRGSPAKAADMLWAAAEAGESWAVLALLERIAPQTKHVRLGVDLADGPDFTRLTDEELDYFNRVLARIETTAPALLPSEKEN